jgi:hypothetical protein
MEEVERNRRQTDVWDWHILERGREAERQLGQIGPRDETAWRPRETRRHDGDLLDSATGRGVLHRDHFVDKIADPTRTDKIQCPFTGTARPSGDRYSIGENHFLNSIPETD